MDTNTNDTPRPNFAGLTEQQVDRCYERAGERMEKGEDYDTALCDEANKAQSRGYPARKAMDRWAKRLQERG